MEQVIDQQQPGPGGDCLRQLDTHPLPVREFTPPQVRALRYPQPIKRLGDPQMPLPAPPPSARRQLQTNVLPHPCPHTRPVPRRQADLGT